MKKEGKKVCFLKNIIWVNIVCDFIMTVTAAVLVTAAFVRFIKYKITDGFLRDLSL